MMKPEDHVLQYVDAYLHEALFPGEAKLVEDHCAACPICQVALEEARKRFDALQTLPMAEASEELILAAERRIKEYRGRRITVARVGWAIAASIALVLAGLHVYYATLSPSPYDLRLLGQTELIAGSDASLRVVLVDHRSGQPIVGAPVEIELAEKNSAERVRLASFTTDQWGSGTPRLRLPNWQTGDYELRVRAYPSGTEETIARTVKLKRSWQVMLTSDKPVYQPGQVIHLRSLSLARPDLKPVAGQEAVFSIADPKGNVVFRKREVTSKYGISSADCPLATEILEGAYEIQCQLGDTTSRLAVEVKKYVLPKFKIALDLDRPYYQPGEKARGTIEARYFFGKPVAGAEVQVEVSTTEVKPTEVYRTTLKTDGAGTARFEFAVPDSLVGRPQESGDARISVLATVRDPAGQKQSKSISRTVTAQAIRVEVIPEAGLLVLWQPNVIYLFTRYPDGRPARTRLAVSGMDRELVTNDLGVASVELTPRLNEIRWTIRATDDSGKIGRREVTLECGKAKGDFLVRTDRAVYDGGQTMRVLALGGGVEPVFLDVIKDGQTMLTDSIPMTGGRGEYQFDLPPGLSGTIELCAYRYGAEGLPVTKTRVIYVRPASELKVQASLDRGEYRPGDRAKLCVTLTDSQGKPIPGAVSLAAVDEAVFSVLSQRPGLERRFFTLEQELLKPVYAIYPWSPDEAFSGPQDARNALEQAIFAKTALGGREGNAILRKILNDPRDQERLLEVLERPDWEVLAERMNLPEAVMSLLRGQNSLHSLSVRSFPERSVQTERLRKRALERVTRAWMAFGIVVGIVCLIWLFHRSVWDILTVLAILCILVALMLPAVQAAREASRTGMAMSELRQFEMASELYKQTFGELPTDRGPNAANTPSLRVREWFPETLLWRPELIADEKGRASVDIDLADSITTWRLSASAVSAEGKLGAAESSIRVFQPFFVDLDLPVALTRGDEVAVPAVVYNYLDKPQTVELTLAEAPWFERLDDVGRIANPSYREARKIELAAGEVRSVSFRIRATKVGRHRLEVHAKGSGVADAIRREIEVVPDGRRVEEVQSGTLQQPADIGWNVPEGMIEGSLKAIVRIHPSTFSQLVEGLDAIFQRPYGCFEQTSSTTYPNVLALDYLRRNQKSVPEVEAKARQYIHLGYQRLLSFEVAGGGFDWFGRAPANRTLTAYGLMEFRDMALVDDVDPNLIERTRQWLLAQQRRDGSWTPEGHMLHDDPARGRGLAELSTTAYIGWAVFVGRAGDARAQATFQYLSSHRPAAIDDPYLLALVANALLAIDPGGSAAGPYLDRLESLRQVSADGKLAWWEQGTSGRTMFYGAGRSGSVETTAMAALAMIGPGRNPATARAALSWLVQQKDAHGTWHSTQATVLALKALLAGTGKPLGGEQERNIEIALDGKPVRQVVIPADQSEVMQQIDLSAQVGQGNHRLAITERSGTAAGYQATLVYYVGDGRDARPTPGRPVATAVEPLKIDLAYERTSLRVDDTVTVTATVVNKTGAVAPMVILDLPVPAGFAVEAEEMTQWVAAGSVARYQITPRSAIVYLRELGPEKPLVLRYRLRATMPVKTTAAPAQAYEYYNPDRRAASATARLTVGPRT